MWAPSCRSCWANWCRFAACPTSAARSARGLDSQLRGRDKSWGAQGRCRRWPWLERTTGSLCLSNAWPLKTSIASSSVNYCIIFCRLLHHNLSIIASVLRFLITCLVTVHVRHCQAISEASLFKGGISPQDPHIEVKSVNTIRTHRSLNHLF